MIPNEGFKKVAWQQADCLERFDVFYHTPVRGGDMVDRASDLVVILNNCIRNTRLYRDEGAEGHARTLYLTDALPLLEQARRDVLEIYGVPTDEDRRE